MSEFSSGDLSPTGKCERSRVAKPEWTTRLSHGTKQYRAEAPCWGSQGCYIPNISSQETVLISLGPNLRWCDCVASNSRGRACRDDNAVLRWLYCTASILRDSIDHFVGVKFRHRIKKVEKHFSISLIKILNRIGLCRTSREMHLFDGNWPFTIAVCSLKLIIGSVHFIDFYIATFFNKNVLYG